MTPERGDERKPLIQRFDVALWRLPVWARKVVIAPAAAVIGVAAGVEEAWPEVRYAWRACMDHVEERPSDG